MHMAFIAVILKRLESIFLVMLKSTKRCSGDTAKGIMNENFNKAGTLRIIVLINTQLKNRKEKPKCAITLITMTKERNVIFGIPTNRIIKSVHTAAVRIMIPGKSARTISRRRETV